MRCREGVPSKVTRLLSQPGGDVKIVGEDSAVLAPAAVCCGQPRRRKLRSVTGLVDRSRDFVSFRKKWR